MAQRSTLRHLPILIAIVAIPFRGLAQGDTCTTALQVVSGVHFADGPASGDGAAGCGMAGYEGDWYRYIPAFTGTIIINSCHPLNNMVDQDTYLKVFTGNCDNLVCIGYNDDMAAACPGNMFASYMQVNVIAGQSYYIAWTSQWDINPFYWELSECAGTVTGATYYDNNDNGVRDTGEPHVGVMLQVQPDGQYVYAGNDPYSYCTSMGAHTITVPTPPTYYNTIPASVSYDITTMGQQVTGADFGFQGIPGIYDGSVSIWGWNAWIGNNTTLHISYANVGTEVINATVILDIDPQQTFVSASVAPTSVVGQLVTWDVGLLVPGAAGSITVTVNTAATVPPNGPVGNGVSIQLEETDVNLSNNSDHLEGIATTSFDPNEKLVSATEISLQDVADQRMLEYTVHFQNEGTAPAVNIVVKDSIDADWDLSTYEMVDASHPYTLTVSNQVAIWTFANIMLPTSDSDELGSQGGFHYRVAPKTSLIAGDQLTNRADIYFDYNPAVLTNTTVTTVELETGIDVAGLGHGLNVLPSPSNGMVNIRWSDVQLNNARFSVIDAMGRTVHTTTLNGVTGRSMDLSFLPEGNYVARLGGVQGEVWTRFVIQR